MAEHTETPWELHADPGGVRICKPDDSERGCFLVAEAEILRLDRIVANANAEFIVRACNSLAPLLEALEDVADSLRSAVNDAELNSGRLMSSTKREADAAAEKAEAALALARGEPARAS